MSCLHDKGTGIQGGEGGGGAGVVDMGDGATKSGNKCNRLRTFAPHTLGSRASLHSWLITSKVYKVNKYKVEFNRF